MEYRLGIKGNIVKEEVDVSIDIPFFLEVSQLSVVLASFTFLL